MPEKTAGFPFPLPHRLLRILAALALLTSLAVAGAVRFHATPAEAAPISGPFVLGLSSAGDRRVVSAAGSTAGSAITMANYIAEGATGANLQRWKFDYIGDAPTYRVYKIVNASSNLCLTMRWVQGFGNLYVADTCGSSFNSLWLIAKGRLPSGGYQLVNRQSNYCLGANASVPSRGGQLQDAPCQNVSDLASTYWRVRNGAHLCEALNVTAMCTRQSPPLYGITANWRHDAAVFPGTTDTEVTQYLGGQTVDPQFFDRVVDWFEMGWGQRLSVSGGSQVRNAYWLERSPGRNEYHSLATLPEGSTANGRLHSYMALGDGASQVDLLFDFNVVGKTTMAEGPRIGFTETGFRHDLAQPVNLPQPLEHRMQVMDITQTWNKPAAAGMSVFQDLPCYGPTWTAGSSTTPSAPPNCYEGTIATVAGTDGRVLADVFRVRKPPAAAVASAPPARRATAGKTTVNGVDQRLLARCLDDDPGACLRTVPGLADCVAARKVCNRLAPVSSPAGDRRAVTPEQVSKSIRTDLNFTDAKKAGETHTKTVTAADYFGSRVDLLALGASEKIIVATGEDTVAGFGGSGDNTAYPGYRVAYRQIDGTLLHACLGASC